MTCDVMFLSCIKYHDYNNYKAINIRIIYQAVNIRIIHHEVNITIKKYFMK